MKFSVITPLYIYDVKRGLDFIRCCNSLDSQSFQDFEHIIVDQTDSPEHQIGIKSTAKRSRYIKQSHVERVLAIRKALEHARGEWICFLDSDDMYLPHTLETFAQTIEENPGYGMFNFGSVHISRDMEIRVRDEFIPKWLEKEQRHEIFGSGTIVNGTYIFHRSMWEELGDFPKIEKLWNPWDFSIAAQEEFPEIKPMFTVDHPDHPDGLAKELGNPWGQDYYLFYKYTRKYQSLAFRKHLYVVYSK